MCYRRFNYGLLKFDESLMRQVRAAGIEFELEKAIDVRLGSDFLYLGGEWHRMCAVYHDADIDQEVPAISPTRVKLENFSSALEL